MKTIEEMKAELLSAGYQMAFTDHHLRYTSYILAPDGWRLDSVLPIPDNPWQVNEDEPKEMIPKAYQHYQTAQELARLREFVSKIADARYPSLIWDITTLEWVKEAKKLLGIEDEAK